MIVNKESAENLQMSNRELYDVILELSRKINNIHRLHFSELELKKRKNQKQKFLAEILTSSVRKPK